MKPNCTSKIINNYDVKTCKTKILNLRSDCSFKRNIKPPFKVGWHKKYLVCNKKILKPLYTSDVKCKGKPKCKNNSNRIFTSIYTPHVTCKRTFDKTGKTLKSICINNENKKCKYTRNIRLPFKLGISKVSALCKTTILNPDKPPHMPASLKCKHTFDKKSKLINSKCKKKTDTIMRQCKYTSKITHFGKVKGRCTTAKRKTKRRIRGGTVTPLPDVMSMFGTLGNSIQSMMSTLYVPPTAAYNPSLPISSNPSSQYLLSPLTQPISTIYKSL